MPQFWESAKKIAGAIRAPSRSLAVGVDQAPRGVVLPIRCSRDGPCAYIELASYPTSTRPITFTSRFCILACNVTKRRWISVEIGCRWVVLLIWKVPFLVHAGHCVPRFIAGARRATKGRICSSTPFGGLRHSARGPSRASSSTSASRGWPRNGPSSTRCSAKSVAVKLMSWPFGVSTGSDVQQETCSTWWKIFEFAMCSSFPRKKMSTPNHRSGTRSSLWSRCSGKRRRSGSARELGTAWLQRDVGEPYSEDRVLPSILSALTN